MATLPHTLDHLGEARARLPEQFKRLPDFGALLACLIARYQGIEDGYHKLYVERWLDAAVGVQLENLGDLLGQAREGRTDDQYRIWIRARVAVNRSNGRGDDLLRILDLVKGDLVGVSIASVPPAAIRVRIAELPDMTTAAEFWGVLNAARAAGVRLWVEYALPPDTGVFAFADGDTEQADAAAGWADNGGVSGGQWADAIG